MTELKITQEKENLLFNRKEIKGSINSEKSPSRHDIIHTLAKKFSVPETNVKIKKISGAFGSKHFNVEANVYHSHHDKDSVELKKKKEQKTAPAA